MNQEHHLHGALASPSPPPGVADDWTVPQHWDELTAGDHWVWDTLFARQQSLLHGRAVSAFERGLDVLHLSRPGVPNFDELSEKLHTRTGWQVVGVPGIVPDDVFFRHLSQKRFPAAVFIRAADQLDYLEEPDMFHDLFGHVPLLADPAVADVMQALGHLGLEAIANGSLHRLSRLYWYSVEFGLACEDSQLRIYGAGILSSFSEVHYSLESPKPRRLNFDLKSVLRARYDIDAFQQLYFVIDRFEDLLTMMQGQDVPAICRELDELEDLDPSNVEGTPVSLPLRR
ncbi:phenylalanine 4-monooxygenase [Sphingomonas piscis]|uniref:Phenylalanine-4-hydroxylase n=1 Tax=Sphingomonas piscis TaxID=2714943 RepID=A0A6G7YNI5_9SPHN|nr:phenylalanine 4-monooxygenase [Sphingomonas piscis]QIK78302.1 phenylalanine 4-monooxygenase [Sphingomonas piscis]